jgi:hypothetical protein
LNEIFTQAIRYWENKHIFYNVGLFIIVAISFAVALPESFNNLRILFCFQIFLLAVLANVAFSTACIVDVFVQYSDFASIWKSIDGSFLPSALPLLRSIHGLYQQGSLVESISKALKSGGSFG